MFETRAAGEELIDRPDAETGLILKSHRFMRLVNRFLGGTSAVRDFVRYAAARHEPNTSLRILDIGSGSGDIPLALLAWADKHNLDLSFTCLDREPRAMEYSRERIRQMENGRLRQVQADILEYAPEEAFDYAIGSLFFHHLTDTEILQLIQRLRMYAKKGVFINDLHRGRLNYLGCLLISPLLGREVLHDALLSIRKGFRSKDLQALLEQVEDAAVTIERRFFGRITALIEWNGGSE